MILVDFSGAAWSVLHGAAYAMGNKLDEDYFRHALLNTIRSYNVKFRRDYGDLVLCMEGRHYWRKDIFEHYKASRKKARDNNKLDMTKVFQWLDTLKQDLRESFPYKVIEVEHAEADDVMAVLSCRAPKEEKVLIVSADGDMFQCLRPNVSIYNMTKKTLSAIQKEQTSSNALF